jgi:hypothetical protein
LKYNNFKGTQIQQHASEVPQTSAVPIDYTSFEVYSSEVLSKSSIQIHGNLKYYLKIINKFCF